MEWRAWNYSGNLEKVWDSSYHSEGWTKESLRPQGKCKAAPLTLGKEQGIPSESKHKCPKQLQKKRSTEVLWFQLHTHLPFFKLVSCSSSNMNWPSPYSNLQWWTCYSRSLCGRWADTRIEIGRWATINTKEVHWALASHSSCYFQCDIMLIFQYFGPSLIYSVLWWGYCSRYISWNMRVKPHWK